MHLVVFRTYILTASSFVRYRFPESIDLILTELNSYNSAVFTSISTNQYYVVPVNDAYARGGPLNPSSLLNYSDDIPIVLTSLQDAAVSNTMKKLDNTACIQAYTNDFLSTRSNLLLVTDDKNSTASAQLSDPILVTSYDTVSYLPKNSDGVTSFSQNTHTTWSCSPDIFGWVCPGPSQCSNPCKDRYQQEVLPNASSWAPLGAGPISYCLSQETPEHCKLHFSLHVISWSYFQLSEGALNVLCSFRYIRGTNDDIGRRGLLVSNKT